MACRIGHAGCIKQQVESAVRGLSCPSWGYDFGAGKIRLNHCYANFHVVAWIYTWNKNNIALNFCNSIAFTTNCLNGYLAFFALFHWGNPWRGRIRSPSRINRFGFKFCHYFILPFSNYAYYDGYFHYLKVFIPNPVYGYFEGCSISYRQAFKFTLPSFNFDG